MTPGEYIKKKREKAGLSQGGLAKALGYKTSQFISNIERDISLPPKENIDKFCEVLKLNKKELVRVIIQHLAREYFK